MRTLTILVVLLTLNGCAVTMTDQKPGAMSLPPAAQPHTFASAGTINKLMLGISRAEALALIGRTATTGYELKGFGSGEYKPVTVANPYRSQKITKGGDVFVVDYYLTEIRKADDAVTEDELTPLVFQADKLVGKGWEFFNQKIKR